MPEPQNQGPEELIDRRLIADSAGDLESTLTRESGLLTDDLFDRVCDRVSHLLSVDVDGAERVARVAHTMAMHGDSQRRRARSDRCEGHVLYSRGRHREALACYDSAADTLRRIGDDIELGRTLSSSLQALILIGLYDEVIRRADEARVLFGKAGDKVRLARLDTNLANLYFRQDRFQEALALYQSALEQAQALGESRDVAVTLHNLAVCHISLNEFSEALAAYERAREHCTKHGLHLLIAQADYNIAYLYYLRGEYTRAIELYRAARERSVTLKDDYHRSLCDLDQAELFLELNLVDDGMQLATQAFAGFEKQQLGYEAAKALAILAIGTSRQGQAFRALDLFEKAREMFTRESNYSWPALIDAYRALVLHQEGRHFEARRYADAALSVFAESEVPTKAAMCELLLARIHLDLGQHEPARSHCAKALERLRGLETPSLAYRAHFLQGQIEEALGNGSRALESYREAHRRLESLRSQLAQDELKVGFLKDKGAVYESLVTLTLEIETGAGALETTLSYIEESKSRALADLMAFRAHALPSRSGAQSQLVEDVHGLRQELNWYYRKIDLAELRQEELSREELARLQRETRDREVELLRTLRELSRTDEEFTSLQAAGTLDVATIRSGLDENTTLLEYYTARDTLVVAVVTRQSVDIIKLTPVDRARHLLRLLRFQLSKFRLGDAYVEQFGSALMRATNAHLEEMYGELIAPIRDRLRTRRLVIVPHAFLHYLPFHALQDGERFLMDDFEISYAPSASVHHLCSAKPASSATGSLVLGVPDPATPHIRDEAVSVSESLPGSRLLLGADADEQALREYGPKSRIVHIATHGIFRYDNPMFSSLQLGGSRLSLFDLYQLQFESDLVTLSGCGTGLNVVEGGDELLGLVRGLLYAGARTALVTLWDVNDRSTATLMKDFYKRYQGGATLTEALSQAMESLREEYPHPYYWAPFVLVGKSAPGHRPETAA